MPAKLWDDAVDWLDWTLSGLEISGDELAIADGYNQGTATLSEAYEAASWQRWSKLIGRVSRPQGTNVHCRVRTGADKATCEAATWSPYIDGFDQDGVMSYDLHVHWLNAGVTAGAFLQIEVSLFGE